MSMFDRATRVSAIVAALSLGAAPTVWAQGVPGALYTVTVPSSQFGSSAFLNYLVETLATSQAFCASLKDPSLNVDCLADRLGDAAKQIPRGSDYDDVRKVLDDTSKDLTRLARSNRDGGRSPVRAAAPVKGATGEVAVQTSRPIVAIKSESVAAVNAQASQILDEAQTVLLRSAESNAIKASQYSKIAEALDSNKVLLRST